MGLDNISLKVDLKKAQTSFNKAIFLYNEEKFLDSLLLFLEVNSILTKYKGIISESLIEFEYAKSNFYIGCIYQDALQVPRDFTISFRHFSIASCNYCSDSQVKLGLMYFDGQGTRYHPALSYAWLLAGKINGSKLIKGSSTFKYLHKTLDPKVKKNARHFASKWIHPLCLDDFNRFNKNRLLDTFNQIKTFFLKYPVK